MNTVQLKNWLVNKGFSYRTNDNYYAKPVGNGWYINVEWQGEELYPVVQATHITQFQPRPNDPYYVPFTADHTNLIKADGITPNKRYVRNNESRTFKQYLVPMAIECLTNRLK